MWITSVFVCVSVVELGPHTTHHGKSLRNHGRPISGKVTSIYWVKLLESFIYFCCACEPMNIAVCWLGSPSEIQNTTISRWLNMNKDPILFGAHNKTLIFVSKLSLNQIFMKRIVNICQTQNSSQSRLQFPMRNLFRNGYNLRQKPFHEAPPTILAIISIYFDRL